MQGPAAICTIRAWLTQAAADTLQSHIKAVAPATVIHARSKCTSWVARARSGGPTPSYNLQSQGLWMIVPNVAALYTAAYCLSRDQWMQGRFVCVQREGGNDAPAIAERFMSCHAKSMPCLDHTVVKPLQTALPQSKGISQTPAQRLASLQTNQKSDRAEEYRRYSQKTCSARELVMQAERQYTYAMRSGHR